MKNKATKLAALTVAALALLSPQCNSAVEAPPRDNPLNFTAPPRKKLLEFGWDQYFNANPAYIRDNIRQMEKRPFDGIIFRLADGGGEVFDISKWDEDKLSPQLKTVSEIKWSRFTDNFVYLMAASTMDWASDSDWEKVAAHTRFCARAARMAKCKGLVLDPEAYGFDPWVYSKQKHAGTMSFTQYEALVRRRGAQFMEAIQSEMPDAIIPMLHMFQSPYGATGLTDSSRVVDPVKRNAVSLKGSLHIAFLNGMLDAMGPDITLIDGNEPAYYFNNTAQFYRAYHSMRQGVKIYVAAENQVKFDRQVRAGHGLYVDHIFNTRPEKDRFGPSMKMNPEQRARWGEHNVYYALDASDDYAWLYSENMNWWKNENLPPGLEAAVISARTKIAAGETLGYDFDAELAVGPPGGLPSRNEQVSEQTAPLVPPEAGVLFWRNDGAAEPPLKTEAPLLNFWNREFKTASPYTNAQVIWDRKNLYVDVRCYEPAMAKLKALASERDSRKPAIREDDVVEIYLSPLTAGVRTYFHYVVNAGGALLDAKIDKSGAVDTAWNGTARVAVQEADNRWVVRLAIPWKDLGVQSPRIGQKLSANVCRTRQAGGALEEYGWAPLRHSGYDNPDDFGTLVLQGEAVKPAPAALPPSIQPNEFGSGASVAELYYPGGVPNLGMFVGQANGWIRNDRALCRFDLKPLLDAGPRIKKVELLFGVASVSGKSTTRELSLYYLPGSVRSLDAEVLHSLAADKVASVTASQAESFTAAQANGLTPIPLRLDVTNQVREAVAKGQTSITFRWQDDEAERIGNPDQETTGTLLSGEQTGGLPSLVITQK